MNDNEKSIQLDILDDIMDNITNLYKYCISLEERIGNLEVDTRHDRETLDKVCHDRETLDKVCHEKFDDMELDISRLYNLMYACDNFCGNCKHCKLFPDGLYKCDITECETDPDDSSCIRFESPQTPKSDAEVCLNCSDKDTPRCYKCSHFPF